METKVLRRGVGVCLAFVWLFLFGETSSFAWDKLKISASTLAGYDDNTSLNADRKGDELAQESIGLHFKTPLSDRVRLRTFYNLLNVNYFEFTDQSVLFQSVNPGFDWFVTPKTWLETDYTLQNVYFSKNNTATSYQHEGRVGIAHKLRDRATLRAGVSGSHRDFAFRRVREASGVLSASDERADSRWVVDSELSFKLFNYFLIRGGLEWYVNESNDVFHDYYDYDAYKIFTGASFELHPKVAAFLKFAYEYREYVARPVRGNANVFQQDDHYTTSAGLFYKWKRNVSVGFLYNYKQKESIEPSQKYAGSIASVGLYYSF